MQKLAFAAVCAAVLQLTTLGFAPKAHAQTSEQRNATISVSGSASVIVPADKVVLSVGVETTNLQIAGAKKESDAIVQSAITALRNLGVGADSIRTDQMQLEPVQESYTPKDSNTTRYRIIAYTVRRTMSVTLNDVKKFDSVLTALFEAKVNHLHGVQFTVNNQRALRDQARQQAVRAAREKAQLLAKELGVTLGMPLSINEGSDYFFPYYGRWGRGDFRNQQQNVVNNRGGSTDGTEVDQVPGQVNVQASVSVVFELKK